jgi:hypothetical protein
LVVLVAATACSSKEAAIPSATVPTAPAQTTTTDPYAVPAVIDTAYVNRVLAGLDQAKGDVTRLIVNARTIPPEAIDRLRSLYSNQAFLQLVIDGYQDDVASGFKDYRPNPGNRKTTVNELLTVQSTCIFVRVTRDFSATSLNATSNQNTWVALGPKQADPSRYNPTPWSYLYDGFQGGGTAPQNPCSSA